VASEKVKHPKKKYQPIQVAAERYHLDLHVFLRSFFSLAASDGVGSLTAAGGRGVLLLQRGKPRSVPWVSPKGMRRWGNNIMMVNE